LVARDEELGREVALKEIQSRHADDPASRSRFLVEAEVTGRLEHPGVVPVYGLGAYPDGRLYYAMRFVGGETLQAAIGRLHEGGKAAARPLELRLLLRRFLDVCNAVAYAHSRGVIHRDLKPANILLGPFGETLVVDWGLAKVVGTADVPGDSCGAVRLSADPSATHGGSILGTPAYMSSEQASGDTDGTGPASDVYSLGATLYCLLTGQAPFPGRDASLVLSAVRRGDFLPPRKVAPWLPRALEAVCLRAMALRPGDRYASARALADDLEHWLADEPVAAYREPPLARLRRWGRRHRTLAAGFGAAVVVAAVSLGVAAVVLAAANAGEREARELADRRRDEAEANFRLARKAVNDYLVEVGDDPRLKEEFRPLRTRLLRTAVPFFEEFVARGGDNPVLRYDLADACSRLGFLLQETGDREQALVWYRRCRDTFEQLAREVPDDWRFRHGLESACGSLGTVYRDAGDYGRSKDAFRDSLVFYDSLPADRKETRPARRGRAVTLGCLGTVHDLAGEPGEARNAFDEAIAVLRDLAKSPSDAESRVELAGMLLERGHLSFGQPGGAASARGDFDEALGLVRPLVADRPGDAKLRKFLAVLLNNSGVLAVPRAPEEAEKLATDAVDFFRALAAKHRDAADLESLLGLALSNRVGFRLRLENYPGALKDAQEAVGVLAPLAERTGQPETRRRLAAALTMRAETRFLAAKDAAGAESDWKRSGDVIGALRAEFPNSDDYARVAAMRWLSRCAMLEKTGKWQGLRDEAGEAVALLNPLVEKARSRQATPLLGMAHAARGKALVQLGDVRTAVLDLDRVAALGGGPEFLPVLALRACVRAELGDYAAAAAQAETLAAEPGLTPVTRYNVACALARASDGTARDKRLPAEERSRKAEGYARLAVEQLGQALPAGDSRLSHVDKDPDLNSLRDRPDFRRLMERLKAKAKPATAP
jgi:serine/threonine-protein kinase